MNLYIWDVVHTFMNKIYLSDTHKRAIWAG